MILASAVHVIRKELLKKVDTTLGFKKQEIDL